MRAVVRETRTTAGNEQDVSDRRLWLKPGNVGII